MYDLAVICAVGFAAWQGSQAGMLAAAVVGLEMIVSLTVGVLFHELVAGLLAEGLKFVAEPFLPSEFPYQGLAVALAFALLTWGTFGALRFRFHRQSPASAPDDEHARPPTIERIAGGLAGGCTGVVIAGAALVTLSMLPLPSALRTDPQGMFFDVGSRVLGMAGEFEPDRHEGVSLVVYGEPASRSSEPSAKLTSEPRVAGPDEASPDEGARFSDVDGNASFSTDLYFLDLDDDGARRVGLREKYVLGDWSGTLQTHARERPKPAAGEQQADSASEPPAGGEAAAAPAAAAKPDPAAEPKAGGEPAADDF